MIKGLHHISMKCQTAEEFGRAKDFYLNVLGLSVKREWAEGIMIRPVRKPYGFLSGLQVFQAKALQNLDNSKLLLRKLKFPNSSIDTGNGLIEIFNNGEGSLAKGAIRHFALLAYPARMAFCTGPLGEEIELFCER